MSVLLGLRIAWTAGREGRVRLALMTLGIALGIVLVLLTLIVLPALQGRIDRYAWHRTDATTTATGDPVLWLPVTDRYEVRDLIRIQVAANGDAPPVPPGMDRLPGPGEVFVSPALAELIANRPEDQLRQRFPGEIAGIIGDAGLVSPAELIAVIGRTPAELRAIDGTIVIRGIEQPGDRLDLDELVQILVIFIAVLLIGPIIVFVSMVTQINATRREQRFAALRLAGATRWQTGILASAETLFAAGVGVVVGWAAFMLAVALLASRVTYEGLPFPMADLRVPASQLILVLAGVPLVALATTLVTLYRAQLTPLGVRRPTRRRRPTAWRLSPLAAGLGGVVYLAGLEPNDTGEPNPTLPVLTLLTALSLAVGLYTAGAWVCMWLGRGLARLSRSAATLIASRRIASDPYATFRAVGGVALASFVATLLATVAVGEGTENDTDPILIPDHVVMVLTRGATDEALERLLAQDGVVVARARPDGTVVVACARLAQVTRLDCPLPTDATSTDLREIYNPPGFAEPGPGDDALPMHALFVPTDGSTAAIERVRTAAIEAAPYGLSRTGADWRALRDQASVSGYATIFRLAMLFAMFVAACSLTVSVVAGLIERRRPFALLRAAGMPLRDLRQVAVLETAAPLVVTALGGIGFAFAVAYATVQGSTSMVWPETSFFVGAGAGLLIAVGVSLASWPLMDAATRHDSVRYE